MEILSLFISGIALVLAVGSLMKTQTISKKQLELEKITAEFKKQLQKLNEAELAKTSAFVDVEYLDFGGNYQIILTNTGQSEAKNVKLKILGEYFPLSQEEYEKQFPIVSLKPGEKMDLWANNEIVAPHHYEVEVSWVTPDRSTQIDKQTVFLK